MASEHGNRARYQSGCRCDPCAKANRDYRRRYERQQARARFKMGEPIASRLHGTSKGYEIGCRCDRCRGIEAQRHQRKRGTTRVLIPRAVPLAPLIERVAIHLGRPADEISQYDFAQAVGVHQRTVCRWMRNGHLPENMSDRVAVHLGWHPAAIWGVDWYIETYDTAKDAA
jgi:DNA-binding transcriptional regulator YiaG